MKTDRELLELAAEAAGIELTRWLAEFPGGGVYVRKVVPEPAEPYSKEVPWFPLRDNNDAFRLAVKLGMRVCIDIRAGFSWIKGYEGSVPHDGDPETATRRAIVRAAAAIQEAKEAP